MDDLELLKKKIKAVLKKYAKDNGLDSPSMYMNAKQMANRTATYRIDKMIADRSVIWKNWDNHVYKNHDEYLSALRGCYEFHGTDSQLLENLKSLGIREIIQEYDECGFEIMRIIY